MKRITKRKSRSRDSYLALIQEFPLKAIKNRDDYDESSTVLDRLAVRAGSLDDGEEQYLEALEVLINAYDDKSYPVAADNRKPLDRLKSLMDSSKTTPGKLRDVLGVSQPLVSLILGGKRELSKRAIARLAEHFKMEPGYFL